MAELNFYDYSVGINSINTTYDALDILEELNISPIEVTDRHILFSDGGKQYKLTYNGQWIIEKSFDIKEVEKDVLQMLSKLDNDNKKLECFGQLILGIQNWIRLVKNKKYNTYYIDLFIGNNKLEYNGHIEDVKININSTII